MENGSLLRCIWKTICENLTTERIWRLYIIFLFLLVSCTTSINDFNNDSQLNYDLKLIIQYSHEYENDATGTIIIDKIEMNTFENGSIISTYPSIKKSYYTKNKNLIKIETFDLSGGIEILSMKENYDKTTIERFEFNNSDTIAYEKEFYDKDKNLIKKIINRESISFGKIQEIIINQYDASGQLIKKEFYNFNNELIRFHTYSYRWNNDTLIVQNFNEKGELVEIIKKYYKNEKLKYEVSTIPNFSIDSMFFENGLLVKEKSIELSNQMERIYLHTYDIENRLIDTKFYIKNRK